MNQKPISDLRRRMLEDMAVRRLGEKTQHDYIKHAETFAVFLGARRTRRRRRTCAGSRCMRSSRARSRRR